jgi:hypothetical protein
MGDRLDTPAALRAKGERCIRLSAFCPPDVAKTLINMGNEYLEKAIVLEQKLKRKQKRLRV